VAGLKAEESGRMITRTPMKPTATAAQRRGPGHSPSTGPASAVASSGPANWTELIVASGR
jgi:hypothetical protein